MSVPSVDISDFDRPNSLNPVQFAAARTAGMRAAVKPAAPALPPTVPPPPPAAPPGGGGGFSSDDFGPDHPFYAKLIPPRPTSYPTVGQPTMPTQAPSAGLNLSQHFLASPAGKAVQSGVGAGIDAVGKALGEAVAPRPSAPPPTTGPGWRMN